MTDESQTTLAQPAWCCITCGEKYGHSVQRDISTYHGDTCGVCGKFTTVTEPRDFFYLRKEWRDHAKA